MHFRIGRVKFSAIEAGFDASRGVAGNVGSKSGFLCRFAPEIFTVDLIDQALEAIEIIRLPTVETPTDTWGHPY